MTRKIAFLLIICFLASNKIRSQVTSVFYQLEFVELTGFYQLNLVIDQGSATTIPTRIFFNNQISLVFPDSLDITIVESLMPLRDNFSYTGTVPTVFNLGYDIDVQGSSYQSIIGSISPVVSFNNLFQEDVVTLFIFDMGGYNEGVRLFNNEADPGSNILVHNFLNGMTIGGSNQLYMGNLPTIVSIEDPQFIVGTEYSSGNRPFHIGDNLGNPNNSAILELESTTKGFLPPRMTEEEIFAIENPEKGLMVYSTTDDVPLYYNGNFWKNFGGEVYGLEVGSMAYGGVVVDVSDAGEVLILDISLVENQVLGPWGCSDTDIVLTQPITGPYDLGKTNTGIILNFCDEEGIAAQVVSDLEVTQDGVVYDDWHLASVEDYLHIQELNISNNGMNTSFWLAHQVDDDNAVIGADDVFGNITVNSISKSVNMNIYAVRTFILP